MKKIVTFLSIFAISYSFSQSDQPCGAPVLPVNVACVNTAGTTVGAAYQNNAANGGTPTCAAPGAPDVWYSFVAPAGGSVTITTDVGTITDGGMALYNGPCGSPTQIACDDDSGPGLMSQINAALTPGVTYYIRVWRYSSGTGTFQICITQAAPPPPPPANDNCGGALPVPVNPAGTCTSQVAGTVVGATASPEANGCGGTADDDVWFSFVATGTTHNIQLNNVAGSTTDLYHSVYAGTCAAPGVALVCSDPNSSTLTGLTPGNTYLVRVYTWTSTPGQTTTFDVCITSPAPPPTNVNCANPNPICSGSPISFTANTALPAASTANPGNNYGCLSTSPNPSWYYLEIATGGNLVVDIAAGSDVDFAIWGSYPNLANALANCNTYPAPVDCSYSTAAVEQVNVAGVVTGQVYVLLVTNYASVVQTINLNNAGGTATTNCSILGAQFTRFEAQKKARLNHLEWTTAFEQNTKYFAVQRSLDGVNWKTLTVVPATGIGKISENYMYDDENPANGINYYRLSLIDQDGSQMYSEVRLVNRDAVSELTVFPVPADNHVNVMVDGEEFVSVKVTSLEGKLIPCQISQSESSFQISTAEMVNGLYLVEVTNADGSVVQQKFMVQHKAE